MNGEITGELIKSAIAKQIKASHGAKIYKEQIVQNFSRPCFFIWTVSVEQRQLTRQLFERVYMMEVRYHAQEEDTRLYETLCEVGNKLAYELKSVDVPILVKSGGEELTEQLLPVKGTEIEFKVSEDVLIFNVNYNVKMKLPTTQQIPMQTLDIHNVRRMK